MLVSAPSVKVRASLGIKVLQNFPPQHRRMSFSHLPVFSSCEVLLVMQRRGLLLC